MNFNFELILFYATIACGVIALIDLILWAPRRKEQYAQIAKNVENPPEQKLPIIIDYARSFFPVLLAVFLLRSFLYEPFRIPSGSLEPTLQIGDFILVNKYKYGIRLPVIHKTVYKTGVPQRGDIMVFRWPGNPSLNFIKRVIGVPGDKVSYVNKIIYINGKEMPQEYDKAAIAVDENGNVSDVIQRTEELSGVKHAIFQVMTDVSADFHDIVVPEGMYFVMGDNRDMSDDSRFWGFVPDKNIVGKASAVWMSWDSFAPWSEVIRWHRIGTRIH